VVAAFAELLFADELAFCSPCQLIGHGFVGVAAGLDLDHVAGKKESVVLILGLKILGVGELGFHGDVFAALKEAAEEADAHALVVVQIGHDVHGLVGIVYELQVLRAPADRGVLTLVHIGDGHGMVVALGDGKVGEVASAIHKKFADIVRGKDSEYEGWVDLI